MFLTKPQLIALEVVRELGYEPHDAVVISKNSSKYKTDNVVVRAIKDGDNYTLNVSSKLRKVLENALVVVQWGPPVREGYNFDGCHVYDVKKFSRPIRKV